MNAKWYGMFALCVLWAFTPGPVAGQTRRTAPATQQPAARQPGNQQNAHANEERRLAVLYAQKNLELARLNLENAVESNRRVARSVSSSDIEQLRQTVKVAEQNLKSVQGAANNPAVATAAANVQLAEDKLRKALTANQRVAGSVPPVEIRRLQLNLDLARITLARERAAGTDPSSVLADLQWELQALASQVADLQQRVDSLSAER